MSSTTARSARSDDTLLLRPRQHTVEARQITADNQPELARWAGGWTYGTSAISWFTRTPGQITYAHVGDWVVRHPDGRFERVPDAQLLARFERVLPVVAE